MSTLVITFLSYGFLPPPWKSRLVSLPILVECFFLNGFFFRGEFPQFFFPLFTFVPQTRRYYRDPLHFSLMTKAFFTPVLTDDFFLFLPSTLPARDSQQRFRVTSSQLCFSFLNPASLSYFLRSMHREALSLARSWRHFFFSPPSLLFL